MHDVLDIIKVFSVFAQQKDPKYIPKLFDDTEPQFIDEITSSKETNLQLYHPQEAKGEGLQQIAKTLLETLREPLVKKMAIEDNASSSISIQNLSNLMFYYSAIANITEKR